MTRVCFSSDKVLPASRTQRAPEVQFRETPSYELQLPVPTVHAPVHERQDPVVAEVSLSRLVAGQTAVLMAGHGHHALQV